MPEIPIHPRPISLPPPSENPLPQLLHTPSGFAILELQGTFHFPTPTPTSGPTTQVGKLVFPLYNPNLHSAEDTKWMKRVYMYVGKGQRMTGECKKLAKPFAIVRKRENRIGEDGNGEGRDGEGDVDMGEDRSPGEEELEIVEIVRYKIIFSSRPEPVSGVAEDV